MLSFFLTSQATNGVDADVVGTITYQGEETTRTEVATGLYYIDVTYGVKIEGSSYNVGTTELENTDTDNRKSTCFNTRD